MKAAQPHSRRDHARSAGRLSCISLVTLATLGLLGSSPIRAAPTPHQSVPNAAPYKHPSRPNILVIVADDLGYSDIGAFGGEISTPNIDALAAAGVRASNFYVAPACSPTRAMLLTGRDHHAVGFGTMVEAASPDQRGAPGYEGFLPRGVPTIAEQLRDAGYQTMMAGKWHLGSGSGQGPSDRGFAKSFALLQGAHNHFGADQSGAFQARKIAPQYRLNGQAASWPAGEYSSDVFASYLSNFLRDSDPQRPFFAYLAFTAPHWPLQARPETIARYRGVYDLGPDAVVRARMERMTASGLMKRDMRTRALGQQAWWDGLSPEQRAFEARKMEIHAAMVEEMDTQIGRIIARLRHDGRLDNTLILFMSDNGPEGLVFDRLINPADPTEQLNLGVDNSLANLGSASSYISYGPKWGQVSAAPYWGTKEHTSEGGIRSPLIIAGPGFLKGSLLAQPMHVLDIKPTLLSAAKVTASKAQHDGQSHYTMLTRKSRNVGESPSVMNWELFYRAAARNGDLKAVYQPTRLPVLGEQSKPGEVKWQLYDLAKDPGETQDISSQQPRTLRRLKNQWRTYARKLRIVLLPEDR